MTESWSPSSPTLGNHSCILRVTVVELAPDGLEFVLLMSSGNLASTFY